MFAVSRIQQGFYVYIEKKRKKLFKDSKPMKRGNDKVSARILSCLMHKMCRMQLKPQMHPMVVHVYHSYRQPEGINRCLPLNGRCSHLCLPAPRINDRSATYSCACPDGFLLQEDGLTCRDGSQLTNYAFYSSEPSVLYLSQCHAVRLWPQYFFNTIYW